MTDSRVSAAGAEVVGQGVPDARLYGGGAEVVGQAADRDARLAAIGVGVVSLTVRRRVTTMGRQARRIEYKPRSRVIVSGGS